VHDKLTVVAIYGHNNGESAIPSLERSLAELPGSQGLLISPRRPRTLPKHIRHKKCHKMTYKQYSLFMMYCLHMYIKTEFCLVVQDDGWVLNGKNFTQKYYEYDYVGAPAHAGMVGNNYHIQFSWQHHPDALVVQNGGFSLRSRKFLRQPSKSGILWKHFDVEPFCNEDVQLCTWLRPELEKHGIKFAPVDVALQFSMEYAGPGVHDKVKFSKLVGHHAPTRRLLDKNYIKVTKPLSEVSDYYREMEFLKFLQKKGYAVECHEPS
jgi:hypothetical protein